MRPGIFIWNCPHDSDGWCQEDGLCASEGISTMELWDVQLAYWFLSVLSLALSRIVPGYGNRVFIYSFKPCQRHKLFPDVFCYLVGGQCCVGMDRPRFEAQPVLHLTDFTRVSRPRWGSGSSFLWKQDTACLSRLLWRLRTFTSGGQPGAQKPR